MRAIIYKTTNDGQQEVLVQVSLSTDGKVLIDGDEIMARNLENEGVRNYEDVTQPIVYPIDGEIFLRQLPFNFRSGYLMAELLED